VAEIVWTLEAARWLESIHGHIAKDNASVAHKVVSGIYEKIQLLRKHPRLGQRFESITDREVREVLYGHYRIAYLVKSDLRVEILGIFHGAMEIERYLK
jgi:plasmid stabilization system protein ParE